MPILPHGPAAPQAHLTIPDVYPDECPEVGLADTFEPDAADLAWWDAHQARAAGEFDPDAADRRWAEAALESDLDARGLASLALDRACGVPSAFVLMDPAL